MLNKLALNSTSELILQGSDESLTEADWNHFRLAAPGNLKLIEGLWFNDQENLNLLGLLIKGYGAHSFAVLETEALRDLLQEKRTDKVSRTLLGYEKAIFYGFKYLEVKGISKEKFFEKEFPNSLNSVFDKNLNENDRVSIFYFAQAMGSSINLQRNNIEKMAYLNHVKKMLTWVCEGDPTIERGACQMFGAILEASTPTLLGGSQMKARDLFQQLVKKQPHNLLGKLSFIQFHILPMLEEDEFSVEMEKLRKELALWYSYNLGQVNALNEKYSESRFFNLYNAVAKERFDIIWSLRKEIF